MTTWGVTYTEHAERDLRDIYEYIAFTLLVPAVATKQTRRIMDAIAKLDQLPLRCQVYDKKPWNRKGIRVLSIDNYLAFYLPVVKSNRVVVLRIMYGGCDIDTQFRSDDGNFSSDTVNLSMNDDEIKKLIQEAKEKVDATEDQI